MLTVLGFAVGHGGAHDHLAFFVEGADLKAGFGFDGFVVVGQSVKAAADCAEYVYCDVNQDIGSRVFRYSGGYAAAYIYGIPEENFISWISLFASNWYA